MLGVLQRVLGGMVGPAALREARRGMALQLYREAESALHACGVTHLASIIGWVWV